MINNWPNLKFSNGHRDGQIKFWNHEWARHGICSGLHHRQYFEKALELKRKINIFQALRDYGIKPGDAYPRGRFEGALQRSKPHISFAMRCLDKNGIKILIEIRVCTSKTHAIPCPGHLGDNCGRGDIKLVSKIEPF